LLRLLRLPTHLRRAHLRTCEAFADLFEALQADPEAARRFAAVARRWRRAPSKQLTEWPFPAV
jgi:hypothetical protein